jgi:hypothetical protein
MRGKLPPDVSALASSAEGRRSKLSFPRGTDNMEPARRRQVRAALLSVYHHSIGNRLELRGAPAVMLPPEAAPMPLASALQTLAETKPRLREAMWTLARAVPAARPTGDNIGRASRYPRELVDVLDDDWIECLKTFDRRRTAYRRQAHIYAAALIAYAQSDTNDAFNVIRRQFAGLSQGEDDFDEGTRKARPFGQFSFSDYIERELGRATRPDRVRRQLRNLEVELGLDLGTYVQEFADAVAFAESFADDSPEDLRVFPASSITVQDARTLQTRVTVTALVSTTDFRCVQIGLDPQCWSLCSDAFLGSRYVRGAFDLATAAIDPMGTFAPEPRNHVFEEDVVISWGPDETKLAAFHNLLNVDVSGREGSITINFDLNRSISSRILWDERPGGILVDEGFVKVRPVTVDVWRITTRKTIRFSDRTPYGGGHARNDFGHVLNFLAPAALAHWVESEMYSAACELVLEMARERRMQEQARAGAAGDAAPSETQGGGP